MAKNVCTLIGLLFLCAALLLISGCGNNRTATSQGQGGVTAQLKWNGSSGKVGKIVASAPAGVATVRLAILSSTGTTLAQNDFQASLGSGTLSRVPVGSGYTFAAYGLDVSNNSIYQGSVNNIAVQAGQITDVGPVVMMLVGGHQANWKLVHNVAAQNNVDQCSECHGIDLNGGASSVSCLSCHISLPIALLASGCTSCHGNGPDGAVAPNRSGSHPQHSAVPGVTCAVCHFGAGTGTTNHANGTTTVLFLNVTSLQARSSIALPYFASGICANVSCHGGIITPVWGGAAPDCRSCHAAGSSVNSPERNSFFSGRHGDHLAKMNPYSNALITCTDCHNISKMTISQHFGGIFNRQFTSPGSTVAGGSTALTDYNVVLRTCSGVTCHANAPTYNVPWD